MSARLVTFLDTLPTNIPLVPGNRLEALCNGEQAYPAMLQAIDTAERSVYLATYIFRADESGRR